MKEWEQDIFLLKKMTSIEDYSIDILSRYDYPIVAHNASFDRKFLVHYGWMNEEYVVYDSIRALKISHPHLFSYSLGFVVGYFGGGSKNILIQLSVM